jgi:hypothetical protein
MKYLKREDGIAQVLIIVLIAVVIAAVGLAVWQSQKSQKSKTAASQTTSSPTPTVAAKVSATPAPSTTPAPANEIAITELGFKMTLPTGLTGLKYVAQTNLPGSAGHPAYSTSTFSTASLEQLAGAGSQCSATNGSIGSIAKYSEDPTTFASGAANTKKVGNFYLVFITPQSPCSNQTAAEQLELSQTSLLRQAFDNATSL